MDLSGLIIIIGAGATIDALADVSKKKEAITPILAGGLLVVILGAVGQVTGQWKLVTALATLYLLAALFVNAPWLTSTAKTLSKG